MAHVQAHEDAAVAQIILLWGILEVDEAEGLVDEIGEFLSHIVSFVLVSGRHAVVVESDAVDDGNE